MTRKNKRYDKDFKLEATKLVVEHGYRVVAIKGRVWVCSGKCIERRVCGV
jgi:transposase-like protein